MGNILEAIFGMRSDVKYERQTRTMELCASLDEFVFSVYQVAQYTESEHDAIGAVVVVRTAHVHAFHNSGIVLAMSHRRPAILTNHIVT